jgi:adenylylsulfate kinase-like enzyme
MQEGKITQMPGIDVPFDIPGKPHLSFLPDDPANIEKAITYLSDAGIFPVE